MPIALKAAGTLYATNVAATSHAVPYPASIAAGDLLVLHISSNGGAVTSPSGWTEVYRETTVSNPKGGLWIKVAAGDETGTLTVTTASTYISAIINSYSGVDTTTPQDATATFVQNSTSLGTSIMPSITTVTAGAMLIYVNAANSGSTTMSSTTGTERQDYGASGGGKSGAYYDELLGAAGATGTRTITLSASRSNWGAMLALRPASGGGGSSFSGSVTLTGTGALSQSGTASGTAGTLVSYVQDVPTTTTQKVNVNVTGITSVRLKVGTNSALTTGVVYSSAVTPNAQGDAELSVTGLTPGTRYYARVDVGSGSEVLDDWSSPGEFVTDINGQLSYSVAFGSCQGGGAAPAMAAVAGKKPDLFLHLGDLYYADGSGTTVANFRSKFDAKRELANNKLVMRTSAFNYVPSDHDGMNNDGNMGSDPTGWTNWNQVYREKLPAAGIPATTGVYRAFTHGRVRFLAIDRRSFATVASATDDAAKTCLGATQKQWFKDQITNATEPVIIVQNPDPWIGGASAGDDSWFGYTTERTELANFIAASGKNVIFLAGDMHALAAEDGSGSPGGIPVFHGAPIDQSASQKGGPYDLGPYPATAVGNVSQYGWLDISDTGTQISVVFKGFSADNTERMTMTKTYSTSTSGSGSLSLGQTGGLANSGTPATPGTLSRSMAGGLALSGAPSTPGTLTRSMAGGLAQSGSPAASSSTLNLGQAGALARSGSPATPGTLNLGQTGALTGTGVPAVPGTLGRTGIGSLVLSGVVAAAGSVSLGQVGSLAPAGSPGQSSSLNLGQAGNLTVGSGAAGFSGSVALSGAGALALAGSPSQSATLSLTGILGKALTGTPDTGGSVGLGMALGRSLSGVPSVGGSLSQTGGGGLTANQTAVTTGGDLAHSMTRTLALVASAITTAGELNLTGAEALVLSGSGAQDGAGSFTMVRVGTLGLTGVPAYNGTLSRTGSGALAPSGSPGAAGTLTRTGAGALTAAGTPGGAGLLTLVRPTVLTVAGVPAVVGNLSLSTDGVLLVDGSPVLEGSLIVTGTGSISFVGTTEGSAMYLKDGTALRAFILQGGILIPVVPQIGASNV